MRGAALAATVVLAGCGGGGETKTVTKEVPTGQGGGEASATATATPAAPASPGVVVSGQAGVDGQTVTFAINELKRSGPTVVVNASVSLPEGNTDTAQISDAFDNGVADRLDGGVSEATDNFDGIALIDPEGRKKYLVARDSEGRCVCSVELSGEFVKADAPINLEATLAAPPAEVTQVNVFVPGVRTFTNVPISG